MSNPKMGKVFQLPILKINRTGQNLTDLNEVILFVRSLRTTAKTYDELKGIDTVIAALMVIKDKVS